ncbi:MAG: GNAT family N-acetyltransferase [Hyphomicrobiales bacterium]|nr:GNAT family N-acetyltransferase [Hyphomicrobiales bacterium]
MQRRRRTIETFNIRRAHFEDLPQVISLDEQVTGLAKPDYWADVFERYGARRLDQRFFLVAQPSKPVGENAILGLIVGEIRAWEFGSEPCGWVFAFSVHPDVRLIGIGTQLFKAISDAFRAAGVTTMRTMVTHDNTLHMTFFRGEGMMAGPYIQLEKRLDEY